MLLQLELRIRVFFDYITKICKGRFWLLQTLLLAFLFSLMMSFPGPEVFNSKLTPIFSKAENPFQRTDYPSGSHDAKLSFRLTVPIIIHIFHLDITGVRIMECCFGFLFFYITAKLIYEISSNRAYSFFITLASGLIFAGSAAFAEGGGYFDGIAITLLLSAFFFKRPVLITFFIFAASFTDERALVASSFVMLYYMKERSFAGLFNSLLTSKCMAVILSWVLYFSFRFYLSVNCGLNTDTGDVGLNLFTAQIHNFILGLWSGLEGFWILIVFAFAGLIVRKEYFFLLLYFISITTVVTVAMSVIDITRSMAYLFPAVFIGFQILNTFSERFFRNTLFAILTISFICPNLYVCGSRDCFIWAPSFPVQLVKRFWDTN